MSIAVLPSFRGQPSNAPLNKIVIHNVLCRFSVHYCKQQKKLGGGLVGNAWGCTSTWRAFIIMTGEWNHTKILTTRIRGCDHLGTRLDHALEGKNLPSNSTINLVCGHWNTWSASMSSLESSSVETFPKFFRNVQSCEHPRMSETSCAMQKDKLVGMFQFKFANMFSLFESVCSI